jgi:hypothetical protein
MNQRLIRFRTWFDEDNKFYEWGMVDKHNFVNAPIGITSKRAITQQYTDFVDCEGVRICEGDLMRWRDQLIVVKFLNTRFIMATKGIYTGNYTKALSWQYGIKGKIVGNVIEHFDMLCGDTVD